VEEKEINLLDYWNLIWKHKRFVVITVTIVTVVALIISLFLPKWYKATAVIMPTANEEGGLSGISGKNLGAMGIGGMLGGNESQMRLLAIKV